MTNFLVTYDLDKPGQKYEELIKAIKTYKNVKATESCWLVRSTKTAKDIREHLVTKMDKNDRLYVTPVARGASWQNPITNGDTIIKFLNGDLD
jgi:hypothetical protein